MVALTVLWPQHTVMATLGFLALANPLKGGIPSVLPFPPLSPSLHCGSVVEIPLGVVVAVVRVVVVVAVV